VQATPEEEIVLQFRNSMPIRLENRLALSYGFKYHSRKPTEWVMYKKVQGPQTVVGNGPDDLSEGIVVELTRRLNKILEAFEDLDFHQHIIKIRCTNYARTLPPKERDWCLAWIKRVVEDDNYNSDDPPWEDTEREVVIT
jgi:hypothetical protein